MPMVAVPDTPYFTVKLAWVVVTDVSTTVVFAPAVVPLVLTIDKVTIGGNLKLE